MKAFQGLKYKGWTVNVHFAVYGNGRHAIKLDSRTDIPIAVASVNVADTDECGDDEVYVKDYSENEGMAQWLADNGIIEPSVIGSVPSGFVVISRYKLTAAALKQPRDQS
jgi:hypothetical protein